MPKEDYIKSTLGLDLLTVVIRHLYCFLNPKFLALDDMDGGSERRLIRWTWSNFSEDATKHHPSHAIRYSILKSYYPGGALRGNDLSFLALEEHDITYNSFWRRAPFLLFAPFHIQRATDSSSWHHSPVRNLVDLKVLARDSLVHWNGQSNLGELISSRFGVAEYGQAQYLWTSNKPAIIRVLLRPEADMPGAFEQFREISVDCPQLTQVEENENFEEARGPTDEADERERNYDLPQTGESMANYKLVAVVVCDSQNESVHLYSSEGEPITPQRFQREGQCFSLGATGKDYMLFYVRAPSRPNQRPAYREVTKEFYELEANMEGVYRTLRHQESPEAGADQEKSGRGKRNRTSSSASDTCRNAEVRTQGDAKFATRA
ncbi:hypothetical protein MGN70_007188 [Eutypa lata]|nr:hypothetical protein MGN70_007188 [Eutypa lata]